MKKAIWLLLLALLFACGSPKTGLPPANTDTETAVTNANTSETNSNTTTSDSYTGATNLENFSPAATVEEAAVVREQDWRKGAVDPTVVIIEYGDFQ